MPRIAWLAALVALSLYAPHAARAASPFAYCRQAGTDDTLREIPASLVPTAVRLFGLSHMPTAIVQHGTYYRCFDSRVFICNVGANLPCGKADTSQNLPPANAWCADNPNSPFIPMYVTGHDTIYDWRCTGTKATPTKTIFHTDPSGFVAEMWKEAD
jgi:hypothetical protein